VRRRSREEAVDLIEAELAKFGATIDKVMQAMDRTFSDYAAALAKALSLTGLPTDKE
jgi:hypothetical protein